MVELRNILVRFGETEVLHNINVQVNDGEFFTFLGPSGCGKTTTLRTITGFVDPVSGNVLMNGKDITKVPIEKRNIGIVFQSYALFPTMTVFDNIAYGLKIKKLSKSDIREKVTNIAGKVNLTDDQLEKAVSQLSGGQQQRVAIARSLVMEPDIICLDEPLSNLDAKLRVQLREELKSMQRDFGITSIYVTHDQEEALTLSDRIAVFNEGNIDQIGTPDEVYNHPKTEFVCNFIGDINRLEKPIYSRIPDLDDTCNHYIRLERVKVGRAVKSGDVEFSGIVGDLEYFGLYTKYSIECCGQTLKVIEKNDGSHLHRKGEQISLVIEPDAVLSYKRG